MCFNVNFRLLYSICAFVGVLLKYEIHFNLAVQFNQQMYATRIQFRITNRSSKKDGDKRQEEEKDDDLLQTGSVVNHATCI